VKVEKRSEIMFGNTLKQHFMVMGADVDVTVGGDRFEVDVQNTGRSEVFQIRLPDDGSVIAKVLFSKPPRVPQGHFACPAAPEGAFL